MDSQCKLKIFGDVDGGRYIVVLHDGVDIREETGSYEEAMNLAAEWIGKETPYTLYTRYGIPRSRGVLKPKEPL